jgi:hypothetical protein
MKESMLVKGFHLLGYGMYNACAIFMQLKKGGRRKLLHFLHYTVFSISAFGRIGVERKSFWLKGFLSMEGSYRAKKGVPDQRERL